MTDDETGGKGPLLRVQNLSIEFGRKTRVRVVDSVSLHIRKQETVALVGESGCGKSVTALSILRLLPRDVGHIPSGTIEFDGRNLITLRESEYRAVRGGSIGMIFQEPMTSLNPVYSIGSQIIEAIRVHTRMSQKEARTAAIGLLDKVGIANASERIDDYPHQLSGGMRQRVMIAIALSCKPALLIADEPTTALDVTVQAQILDLLEALQRDLGMSMLFITHDFGLVRERADFVYVMYAGKVVEEGPTKALFDKPRHPYTKKLIESARSLEEPTSPDRLPTIPGVVPNLSRLPSGCRFQDRCNLVTKICKDTEPTLCAVGPKRAVACFRTEELA